MVWIPILALNLLLALFTAWIARTKGRAFYIWLAFGFFLPIWALFFAVLINDNTSKRAFPDPRRRGRWGQY
jgi:hypothetical protein